MSLGIFDLATFDFSSRRSSVISQHGMVAASQPLAVLAGLEILQSGGNAADASVAVAAALNVTEPTSTGIGGDCFALYYDASHSKVTALNGSGRTPHALTLERLKEDGFENELPPYHPYTITVPGACAAWFDLLEQHGRLTMAEVLQPAIKLSEEGFPVAPLTAYYWQRGVENQLLHAEGGLELTIQGRAPYAGEIFHNPGLAATFHKLADRGRDVFYQGEIAEAIVGVVQKVGGCLTLEDLASHTSTWDQPISSVYRGYRVWECPPNGQGLAALIALNILENFDLNDTKPQSAERYHLLIESMRLAFADTSWYVADPVFNSIPLDILLSKNYAQKRTESIDLQKTNLNCEKGNPVSSTDTVYFAVVDSERNACSFINSNFMGFGTGIVPQGWGFTLQNRGHNFSLDPLHPNALAPKKRPYHTIIPSLITVASNQVERSGENNQREYLFACLGVMGGFMQPQGHLQVVSGLIDDSLDVQDALDRPRFCIEDGNITGYVALEEGIPEQVMQQLIQMGHRVRLVSGFNRSLFGRGQVIIYERIHDVLWGGSDPRADGCAMGY